jgi:hypothetical protein
LTFEVIAGTHSTEVEPFSKKEAFSYTMSSNEVLCIVAYRRLICGLKLPEWLPDSFQFLAMHDEQISTHLCETGACHPEVSNTSKRDHAAFQGHNHSHRSSHSEWIQ